MKFGRIRKNSPAVLAKGVNCKGLLIRNEDALYEKTYPRKPDPKYNYINPDQESYCINPDLECYCINPDTECNCINPDAKGYCTLVN